MVTDLDLRRLRYFVAVAQELHFGRAADRLHVAQPALSQQIKQFEREVGGQLFDRTTRSVSLTPAGERLLQRAPVILEECERAVAEVRSIAGGEEGTIRLGFIGSATYDVMPEVVRRLRNRMPRVSVELHGERLSGQLAEEVRAGVLDIAMLRPCPAAEGLQLQELRREGILVALPENHARARAEVVELSDLAGEDFVSYPQDRSVTATVQRDACLRAGFDPRVVVQVAQTATLLTFVAAGLGIALVPAGVQAVRLPGVVFRPLADATPTLPLAIAHRPAESSALPTRVAAVIRSFYVH